MILSPFPYKILAKDKVNAGIIFKIPKFCNTNVDNLKCKEFYKSIIHNIGFHKCPYGFCVECIPVETEYIILTCLNVEQKSDRKKIQKHLCNQDFLPRLPLLEYEYIRNNFVSHLISNKSSLQFEQEKSRVQVEKELLDNTIHEVRKLNNQIKGYTSKLNYGLQNLRERTDYIDKLNLDIIATANLMSIRLNTYDLEVNPELNLNSSPKEIPIYKKIEKIYKCLGIEIGKKNINVKLEGKSYNLFYSSDVIEIAFFILLENAIKYSPQSKTIDIIFKENRDELILTFKNWGIRPRDNEMSLLTNRGYRGSVIKNDPNIEGRGIGLHLFKLICETNNILFKIKLGDDNYYENNYRFSPFIVELHFENMIQGEMPAGDEHNSTI
jgi:K+-sensing histidine kinase KdpD